MRGIKYLLVMTMVIFSGASAYAAACSQMQEGLLLSEAQNLENNPSAHGSMLENFDGGVERNRRLITYTGLDVDDDSFSEYFYKKSNDPAKPDTYLRVFHLENQDASGSYTGAFTTLITNTQVSDVVKCDTDDMNVAISFSSGFPSISIDLKCSEDLDIKGVNGAIIFSADQAIISADSWEKNGSPVTCNGETSTTMSTYTKIN